MTATIMSLTGQPSRLAPQPLPSRPIVPAAPVAPQQAQTAANPFSGSQAPAQPSAAPVQPAAAPAAQPQEAPQDFVKPSLDINQARENINAAYAKRIAQEQWNANFPGITPEQRTLHSQQAAALQSEMQSKLAALQTPTEKTFNDGTNRVWVGNDYIGFKPTSAPAVSAPQQAFEKGYSEDQGKAYAKKASTIEANSASAQSELPQLQILQKLMHDPAFYSGWQAGNVQTMSAAAQALGLSDGKTADLMGFAKKLGAAGSLENIREMAQSGAVRVPEMHMIEKSNFDENNTPAANRAVVDIRARLAQRQIEIADLANAYANKHDGRIDRGFDQELRTHFKGQPLFNDQEISDYDSLLTGKKQAAKPAASSGPSHSREDVEAEMRKRGMMK
jgi:hypothetical protein